MELYPSFFCSCPPCLRVRYVNKPKPFSCSYNRPSFCTRTPEALSWQNVWNKRVVYQKTSENLRGLNYTPLHIFWDPNLTCTPMCIISLSSNPMNLCHSKNFMVPNQWFFPHPIKAATLHSRCHHPYPKPASWISLLSCWLQWMATLKVNLHTRTNMVWVCRISVTAMHVHNQRSGGTLIIEKKENLSMIMLIWWRDGKGRGRGRLT